jgi:hypothetical protein
MDFKKCRENAFDRLLADKPALVALPQIFEQSN